MKNITVPITLVTGFLESGKTTAIMQIMEQGFGDFKGGTLLIDVEEKGEAAYDQELLRRRNVVCVEADDPGLLTADYFQSLADAYAPEQVFIEYNGTFKVNYLERLTLPKGWGIVRQMTILDGSVFHIYRKHQKEQFRDMTAGADVVLFNRCEPDLDQLKIFATDVRSVNKTAQVVFEDKEGKIITCI